MFHVLIVSLLNMRSMLKLSLTAGFVVAEPGNRIFKNSLNCRIT